MMRLLLSCELSQVGLIFAYNLDLVIKDKPVTDLYAMRKSRVMCGIGIISLYVQMNLRERAYVLSRLELGSVSSEQG
jgi:hypothetical protein